MCVAIPGRVVELEGEKAKVDVLHNICEANIKLVRPQIGDYVLIHAGFALEIIKKDAAEELLEIFTELAEAENEDA